MLAIRQALIGFCVIALLSSCASTTTLESQGKIRDPRQARIYFLREKGFVAMAITPTIKINGQDVGELANGSYFFVDRAPGRYAITVDHSLGVGTFVADVTVSGGAEYYFEVGPTTPGGRGVMLPVLAGNVGTPAREA